MHLLAYLFSLKMYSVPNSQKIVEVLLTELFSAYLISKSIPKRPVQIVLALFHVPRREPAHYFSLTISLVPDPLSSHTVGLEDTSWESSSCRFW